MELDNIQKCNGVYMARYQPEGCVGPGSVLRQGDYEWSVLDTNFTIEGEPIVVLADFGKQRQEPSEGYTGHD